jgi:hypothetical protein
MLEQPSQIFVLKGALAMTRTKNGAISPSTSKLGLNLYSRMQIPSLSSGCEIVPWIVAGMANKQLRNFAPTT